MSKVITAPLKVFVAAGKASPSPPLGPALGQRGVNINEFCKQFNDRTKDYTPGEILPVRIYSKADRSFAFEVRAPTSSMILKKAARVQKGTPMPQRIFVGELTLKQLYHCAEAKAKCPSLAGASVESVAKMLVGSARTCGLKLIPGREADYMNLETEETVRTGKKKKMVLPDVVEDYDELY